MSDARYDLVRACFENMEEIFPAGDPRNDRTSNALKPKRYLPQMPQMPQRVSPAFKPLPMQEDLFEERAAIIEYDGGLPRPLAEFMARKMGRDSTSAQEMLPVSEIDIDIAERYRSDCISHTH